MKRWMPLLMATVALVATAGACDTPPPSDWQAPVVESISLSPEPVVAGSPFTVRVTATDDRHVVFLQVGWPYGPAGSTPTYPCSEPTVPAGPSVTIEVTCTLPADSVNGEWHTSVLAGDNECSRCSSSRDATFTVVGGVDEDPPAPT